MSALPKVSPSDRCCPFCGVATDVPHESQQGCIAALHEEIGRLRGVLASLRPAGVRQAPRDEEHATPRIRLTAD